MEQQNVAKFCQKLYYCCCANIASKKQQNQTEKQELGLAAEGLFSTLQGHEQIRACASAASRPA